MKGDVYVFPSLVTRPSFLFPFRVIGFLFYRRQYALTAPHPLRKSQHTLPGVLTVWYITLVAGGLAAADRPSSLCGIPPSRGKKWVMGRRSCGSAWPLWED